MVVPEGLIDMLDTGSDLIHIGYAGDGFPIYYSQSGAYESSYYLKSGTRDNTEIGGTYDGTYTQDFGFDSARGDLDECNGANVEGSYAYFVTDEFPYIGRCFNGEVDPSFERKGPGQAGLGSDRSGPPSGARGGGFGNHYGGDQPDDRPAGGTAGFPPPSLDHDQDFDLYPPQKGKSLEGDRMPPIPPQSGLPPQHNPHPGESGFNKLPAYPDGTHPPSSGPAWDSSTDDYTDAAGHPSPAYPDVEHMAYDKPQQDSDAVVSAVACSEAVDPSIVRYGYNQVRDSAGTVVPPQGKPIQDGYKLVSTDSYNVDQNTREYARIFAIMAPIREALMCDIGGTTAAEWSAMTQVLTLNNIKTTQSLTGTPKEQYYSSTGIYEHLVTDGKDFHPMMKYLEEAELELKCLAFDASFDFTNPEGDNHCVTHGFQQGKGLVLQ